MAVDRHIPLIPKQVKAIIREIHQRAVETGEKRQSRNPEVGPSKKYMQGFYCRCPSLTNRNADC